MNELFLILGWTGVFAPMVLGAVGSMTGCALAGQAAIGALLDTEGGYGKYIGISAMPSSQAVYGIVMMFSLNRVVTIENVPGLFAIGSLTGIALFFSAIYQGRCCATAIHAAKSKPEIFGLSLAPAAMVEGFAVFVFIFALVLAAGVPVAG